MDALFLSPADCWIIVDKSIIFLDDLDDIKNLNLDFYYQNLDSINENFELSKEYDILDDWIYNNCHKPALEKCPLCRKKLGFASR